MSEHQPDSAAKAISFLMFGIVAGVGLDLLGKWLLADYSLPQFILLRSLFGGAILFALVGRFGGIKALATQRLGWHLLRSLLATGAMFGFFYGISQIPLVDALTIGFTAPLMATALSVPLLGERVGWRRWAAVVVGFIGVVIVLRPGAGLVSFAALAVIAAAFFYACLAITARHLTNTENTFALSMYVLIGPLIISGFMTPARWIPPEPGEWILFAAAGLFSALGWLGIVGAYRRAAPAVLAPFEYTALIWGGLAGYLIWDEVPDGPVLLGGMIIVVSGLFVVYRELGRSRAMTRYLRVLTGSASEGAAAERVEGEIESVGAASAATTQRIAAEATPTNELTSSLPPSEPPS